MSAVKPAAYPPLPPNMYESTVLKSQVLSRYKECMRAKSYSLFLHLLQYRTLNVHMTFWILPVRHSYLFGHYPTWVTNSLIKAKRHSHDSMD